MKVISIDKIKSEEFEIRWEYEDQLPRIPRKIYNRMFRFSQVVNGVRMFPYVLKNVSWERYYIV